MKLIAVYNVFDGQELLETSINCIRDHVYKVFAVCQHKAYNGFPYVDGYIEARRLKELGLIDEVYMWEGTKQIDKRQYCLQVAKDAGATHYIGLDCDEMYVPKEFAKAKELVKDWPGSYCKIKTYFKSPELTIGLDNYYVPFIHKINKNSFTGSKDYPVKVDPRRSINGGAKEVDIIMHHYSWVRKDISIKVNAHDSRNVILNSGLLEDYKRAEEGSFIKHYNSKLEKTADEFKIQF